MCDLIKSWKQTPESLFLRSPPSTRKAFVFVVFVMEKHGFGVYALTTRGWLCSNRLDPFDPLSAPKPAVLKALEHPPSELPSSRPKTDASCCKTPDSVPSSLKLSRSLGKAWSNNEVQRALSLGWPAAYSPTKGLPAPGGGDTNSTERSRGLALKK